MCVGIEQLNQSSIFLKGMADVNLLVKATLQHIHELAFNPNGTRVTQVRKWSGHILYVQEVVTYLI